MFCIKDFILLLQGCHIFHSSPPPLTPFLHLPSPLSPWFAICTSYGLQLTSPSSQVVTHSLWIAIWTSVHREGRLISVAIDDRLEKAGHEKNNRTNEIKENNNKRNVRMFSGWGQINGACLEGMAYVKVHSWGQDTPQTLHSGKQFQSCREAGVSKLSQWRAR